MSVLALVWCTPDELLAEVVFFSSYFTAGKYVFMSIRKYLKLEFAGG